MADIELGSSPDSIYLQSNELEIAVEHRSFTTVSQEYFDLFNLPRELRDNIYREYFVDLTVDVPVFTGVTRQCPAIFLANKQLFLEAKEAFYKESTFVLDYFDSFYGSSFQNDEKILQTLDKVNKVVFAVDVDQESIYEDDFDLEMLFDRWIDLLTERFQIKGTKLHLAINWIAPSIYNVPSLWWTESFMRHSIWYAARLRPKVAAFRERLKKEELNVVLTSEAEDRADVQGKFLHNSRDVLYKDPAKGTIGRVMPVYARYSCRIAFYLHEQEDILDDSGTSKPLPDLSHDELVRGIFQ